MTKRFWVILAALAVLFVGIIIFTGGSNGGNSGGNGQAQATRHIRGEGQAGVTLVEYGDFQCPACLAYAPVIQQVFARHSNDVYFQFRHLPLTQVHPNAFAAARAAEAAALQGKFWEMHDLLYRQDKWLVWTESQSPQQVFEGYATEIGLDLAKFKQDYASDKANDAVNADIAAFRNTGRQMSTPTFFLNGRYIPNAELSDQGSPSVDKMSKVIQAEIDKKRQ